MTMYLVFAAIVVAVLVIFGIPAITRQVKIPRVLRWVELEDAELTEAAVHLFADTDAAAQELGFRPLENFTVPGLARGNENRLYLNPEEATSMIATVLAAGKERSRMLEFSTGFEDGVELCTSNAQVSGLFEQPDWHQIRQLPALTDLKRLHQAHRRRVSERLAQGASPRPVPENRLLDEMLRSQARQIEHQVEQGLFRLDEEAGMFVATPWIALRGILNFLNPLADNFTLSRFALGFGLGLALALAAILLAQPLGWPEFLRQVFPNATAGQITFLLYCPGFVLAGLVVGWQFREKGFLWGFLISLPGLILLPAAVSQPIFYSIIAAWSGQTANRFRQARDSGLSSTQAFTGLIVLAVLVVVGYYYST